MVLKMKHTPGPWHWRSDSLTHRQFDIYTKKSQNQHVCTVNNLSVEKLYTRDTGIAIAFANACLIAAAPDLLAALSNLIDAAVDVYDGQSAEFAQLVQATEAACTVLKRAAGQ